jgi:hypothetical protein
MDSVITDPTRGCDRTILLRILSDNAVSSDQPSNAGFEAGLSDNLVLGLVVEAKVPVAADIEFDGSEVGEHDIDCQWTG